MKFNHVLLLLVVCHLAQSAVAGGIDASKLPPASKQEGVTYVKDIRPILAASCFRCHGDRQHKSDLRLDSLASVMKGGENGKIVVPGASAKSSIVVAISQLDPEFSMPPKPRAGKPPGGAAAAGGSGGGTNAPGRPPGQRPGGPGGPGGNQPPPKPLTSEQVGLVRAWIDLGAK